MERRVQDLTLSPRDGYALPASIRTLQGLLLSAIAVFREAERQAKNNSVSPDVIAELNALIALSAAFRTQVIGEFSQRKAGAD